jgi:hypothetical protein
VLQLKEQTIANTQTREQLKVRCVRIQLPWLVLLLIGGLELSL